MSVLLLTMLCATVMFQDTTESNMTEDRYFFFPGDGNGLHYLVDTEAPVDKVFLQKYAKDPNSNSYWLLTRRNPIKAQALIYRNVNSVLHSNLDISKVTIFLAHGWRGGKENEMNRILSRAFLHNGDVNVIIVDWSYLSMNKNYMTAKSGTADVGKCLGMFLNWLVDELGLSYRRVHLVGFSLGGHLVGNAGRMANGLVRKITALDPANPLWESDEDRLAPTDAKYIEVIHTNTAFLGMKGPCGDVDFYPNGGKRMPGCIVNSCSHSKAYQYLASSLKHGHLLAYKCETYEDVTEDRCNGVQYHMGHNNLTRKQWVYFCPCAVEFNQLNCVGGGNRNLNIHMKITISLTYLQRQ